MTRKPIDERKGAKTPSNVHTKKKSFWLSMFYAIAIALVMRSSLVEAFTIPSGSMKNTVLVGDYLFVNKLSYFLQTPKYLPFTSVEIPHLRIKTGDIERGDVIVFEYPGDRDLVEPREKNVNYIKRCIGLPGDVVQVIDQKVYVNGTPAKDAEGAVYATPPLVKNLADPQIFPTVHFIFQKRETSFN